MFSLLTGLFYSQEEPQPKKYQHIISWELLSKLRDGRIDAADECFLAVIENEAPDYSKQVCEYLNQQFRLLSNNEAEVEGRVSLRLTYKTDESPVQTIYTTIFADGSAFPNMVAILKQNLLRK